MADIGASQKSLFPSVEGIGRRIGTALLASTPEGVSYLNNAKQNEIRMQKLRQDQEEAERQGRLDSAGKQIELFGPLLKDQNARDSVPPNDLKKMQDGLANAIQVIAEVDPAAAKTAAAMYMPDVELREVETKDNLGNVVKTLEPEVPGMVTQQISGEQLDTQAELAQQESKERMKSQFRQKEAVLGTEVGATAAMTEAQKGKQLVRFQDARENQKFLESRIDRSIELLQKPGAMRGALGALANVAESFADQAGQLFGRKPITGSKVEADFISENTSAATKAALINGKLDANLVTIAFMLAQVNNPDGKISDQDVREANKMVKGDQGSIPVMISALQEVKGLGRDRVGAIRSVLEEDGIINKQPEKPVAEMSEADLQAEYEKLLREQSGK